MTTPPSQDVGELISPTMYSMTMTQCCKPLFTCMSVGYMIDEISLTIKCLGIVIITACVHACFRANDRSKMIDRSSHY